MARPPIEARARSFDSEQSLEVFPEEEHRPGRRVDNEVLVAPL